MTTRSVRLAYPVRLEAEEGGPCWRRFPTFRKP